MGGLFGVASKGDCLFDLFFGTDYHSHLGTRRGGQDIVPSPFLAAELPWWETPPVSPICVRL